eukprot:2035508-Pleurochrysis_carterae.AAC.2
MHLRLLPPPSPLVAFDGSGFKYSQRASSQTTDPSHLGKDAAPRAAYASPCARSCGHARSLALSETNLRARRRAELKITLCSTETPTRARVASCDSRSHDDSSAAPLCSQPNRCARL